MPIFESQNMLNQLFSTTFEKILHLASNLSQFVWRELPLQVCMPMFESQNMLNQLFSTTFENKSYTVIYMARHFNHHRK